MKKFLHNKFLQNSIFLLPICIIFVVLTVGSMMTESLTYDEPLHLSEGIAAWKDSTFSVDVYNPPFIGEIMAIPNLLGLEKFVPKTIPFWEYVPARLVTVCFGVLTIVAVYFVILKISGKTAALVGATIIALNPNILAHSHYVTFDVGYMFFLFVSYFLYYLYLKTENRKIIFPLILVTGYALSSKVTGLVFIGLTYFLTYIYYTKRIKKKKIFHFFPFLFSMFAVMLVVWSTYFFTFDVVIRNRPDFLRISERLYEYSKKEDIPTLTRTIDSFSTIQLPLGTYFASIKNAAVRRFYPMEIFVFGKSYQRVPWYATIAIVFLKTPLPLVLLCILSLAILIKFKKYEQINIWIIPVFSMLIIFSLTGEQPNIRYLIAIYPFLAVLISQAFLASSYRIKQLIFVLLFSSYFSSLLVYPRYISYANIFIPENKRFTVFSDSNIDWGQTLPSIVSYIKSNHYSSIRLSYQGTDDGKKYGLTSDRKFELYRKEGICAFHTIKESENIIPTATLITVSNWYYCGYYKQPIYSIDNIRAVLDEAILLF